MLIVGINVCYLPRADNHERIQKSRTHVRAIEPLLSSRAAPISPNLSRFWC